MRLLGFPRYIDISDSEKVLRAIQLTDDDVPLDLITRALRNTLATSEGM